MIDLHCHLIPKVDDGSSSLAESLEMARMAVADGITITACTPHILPGSYNNEGTGIRHSVAELQAALDEANIPLILTSGADAHIAPDLLDGLKSGRVPTLGNSRYFLLEPPKATLPPKFEDFLFRFLTWGYVPIITHPERLAWIENQYDVIQRAVQNGVWMQLTGDSILGKFGQRVRYWSERMLDDGLVHLVASDAHNKDHRPPRLAEAMAAVEKRLGKDEARQMAALRPVGILRNLKSSEIGVANRSDQSSTGTVDQR